MSQVKVVAGSGGFGGPLFLEATESKNKIVSVSGGLILPVAEKLAEMLHCEAIDGFNHPVPDEEIIAVVIDCGGTARCGVYPKKGILTINVLPVGQSGPLAKYIVPELYVSGVTVNELSLVEGNEGEPVISEPPSFNQESAEAPEIKQNKPNFITWLATKISGVMSHFYSAGKESISTVIRNVLPFMAFVSLLIGFINGTGIGNFISTQLIPLSGSLLGMILIAFICAIPILSPLLGPGAVIAQTVGVLIGSQIAAGALPPSFALPALFAINSQVGCDFIPVGLSMAEADPETIEIGTPAILFSRMITGPGAVVIAYLFSIGLYPNA